MCLGKKILWLMGCGREERGKRIWIRIGYDAPIHLSWELRRSRNELGFKSAELEELAGYSF